MKWLELSVDAPPEFVEPLSQLFLRYGEGGVAVQEKFEDGAKDIPKGPNVRVITFLPKDSTTLDRVGRIDVGVKLVAQLAAISPLAQREIEEKDWETAWREHFHPLRVGSRIVIVPTWRSYRSRAGDAIVNLDPGMAFGTGHHPTTKLCLEAIERSVGRKSVALDVGCGSGILSIAAAKLGCARVTAIDVDAHAVKVAKENVQQNGVSDVVSVLEGTLPSRDVPNAAFDTVVANISANVVIEVAEHLVAALKPGGTLIASGILGPKADAVIEAFRVHMADVTFAATEDDWTTLTLSRA